MLALGPAAKGQGQIMPTEHYKDQYHHDDEIAAKALVLAKRMITKLTELLGCEVYNIVHNNGELSGQTVFNFNMNLIPIYKNDNVGLVWNVGTLTEEDKLEILSKLNEQ